MEETLIKVVPADARKRKKKIDKFEPLNLTTAVARRQAWTPTKPKIGEDKDPRSTFGANLARNFSNIGSLDATSKISVLANDSKYIAENEVKRRKVDIAEHCFANRKTASVPSLPSSTRPKLVRAKSPTKKSRTITALATAHAPPESNDAADPMRQWLTSTQANIDAERNPETFETRVACKSTTSESAKSRSRLKSPSTVKSTLNAQELIFATGSQLIRDESPTLLRDTVEAMKQSELDPWSSPIRSQQTAKTAEYSVTPKKRGTARFHGRRSLWSVANRDEHEALLHMDSSYDQPVIMASFIGGEVLRQAESIHGLAEDLQADSTHLLKSASPESRLALDDNFASPVRAGSNLPKVLRRSYTTSATSPSSKRMKHISAPVEQKANNTSTTTGSILSRSPSKKKIPPKPNYAAWSDENLKASVKAHGFNRLRARKSMIDKLDECWAAQYGIDPSIVKAATKKALKETKSNIAGKVLADVHHAAPRPAPKVKQRRERSTKVTETSTSEALTPASDDEIVDISDIDITCPSAFDLLSNIRVDDDEDENDLAHVVPSTAPIQGTGVAAVSISSARGNSSRFLTPPPTIPQPQESSPAFEVTKSKIKSSKKTHEIVELPDSPPPTANDTCLPNSQTDTPLASRILEAITQAPIDNGSRNHYKSPTWHEKTLIYDPIVIEDLTIWLNTKGFNAINEDREIEADEVKEWCHAHGICCLWQGGWRGNKKKIVPDES